MVLQLHMLLKKKRDGKIKAYTVSGGNKKQTYIPKEVSSYPTVSTESVLLVSLLDSEENIDVSVIDILSAFIYTRVK